MGAAAGASCAMFMLMLSPYKVLDLTDQWGMFCGYILAHLGAQVLAVEPPGGSAVRAMQPLAGDGNGPESGLWWQAYGRGKSSLVLDLDSGPGSARLRGLAADADVLIESFSTVEAVRLGVDYETLAAVNPGLICVSVSPFGRSGPKADWPATDLTVWASSGAHILAGDDDRAPVRTSVPQSFLHAGADAAWRSMCKVMGLDAAAEDPGLATAEGRRKRADELDHLVSGWTRSREEQEVQSALVAAGVAAHVVQNTAECLADPQLRHRNHFQAVDHASVGELVIESSRFKLSRTPARSSRPGPELGEHNFQVLKEILGYDTERIARVLASGAMG